VTIIGGKPSKKKTGFEPTPDQDGGTEAFVDDDGGLVFFEEISSSRRGPPFGSGVGEKTRYIFPEGSRKHLHGKKQRENSVRSLSVTVCSYH